MLPWATKAWHCLMRILGDVATCTPLALFSRTDRLFYWRYDPWVNCIARVFSVRIVRVFLHCFKILCIERELVYIIFYCIKHELVSSSASFLGLAFFMLSLMYAVLKVMSVAKLVTIEKLVLASLYLNWISGPTMPFIYSCVLAACLLRSVAM